MTASEPDRTPADRSVYERLALHLPNDIGIGSALITMVEPHEGQEYDYNRWYEDDHFFSGAMHGPWVYAGRRWVAPRALRDLRPAVNEPAFEPADAGCYISLYWSTPGHEDDTERWSFLAMAEALMPHGRGFPQRDHVYTAFHHYRFGVVRPGSGPMKPHLALNHPFAGLVVEVVDAADVSDQEALEEWLANDHLPSVLLGSPAVMCLAFAPREFAQGRIEQPGTPPVAPTAKVGQRLCLLWFLEQDPADVFPEALAAHHNALAAHPKASLALSAPFIPTIPGTDAYVDQLR